MAITENRRMQQLRGKYADLDKSKMLVGEIAVPSDHSPIMKVDVDKYIELVSSEDTEYIEKITAEIEQTLDDVKQLAIDKVGINNSIESDLQTYSSRKIQSMHDEQAESITNQITDQFKVLSGTEIVATDSSSGYATDFSCKAKTEQKQYSGKNLLNNTATTQTVNGVTFTVNKDKSVTVNGTATSDTSLTIGTKPLEAGVSYILSGCPSGGSTNTYYLRYMGFAYDVGNGSTIKYDTSYSMPIEIGVKSGVTINATFYPMFRLASITDATYEPYTGGTPSPNPSYPQAIYNSGDCVELQNGAYNFNTGIYITEPRYVSNRYKIPCNGGDVVRIKTEQIFNQGGLVYYNEDTYVSKSDVIENVDFTEFEATVPSGVTHFNFDLRQASAIDLETAGKIELTVNGKYVLQVKSCNKNELPITTTTQTFYGVDFTINENKSITAKGVATASIVFPIGNFIANEEIYKLTGCPANSDGIGLRLLANGVHVTHDVGNGTSYKPTKGTILQVCIVMPKGTTVDTTFYPMIRKASITDATYVEHKEHILTILLDEPPRAVNDVKDVIEYVNDGYKVRRKIATRVLNNEDGWVVSTPTTSGLNRYDVYISDTSRKVYSAMCSHFVMSSATTNFADNVTEVSFAVHPTNGNFCFFTEFATVDEFKAWLAENPITVQYEMANEVIEDIADQTPFYQIPTYDGGTTISTTDRLQPQIEVEYPTNRVSGVASAGYAKASALSDKILSYQLRDIPGDVLGALFSVELPDGVDGRNCTVITSYCITPTKYSEMDAGYPWYYGGNFNTYTGDNGVISTISGYITEATSGYAHVNVTVIRNDI